MIRDAVAGAGLAKEIEIKLLIEPHRVQDVEGLALIREFSEGPATRKRLISTYFDTPGLDLRRRGFGLRIRRDGQRRIQTLKEQAGRDDGLSIREELEHPVESDEPDLSLLRETPYAYLGEDRPLQKDLRALFTTDFQRTAWRLRPKPGVHIEMALDVGEIRRQDARVSICEIELELITGTREDLESLAARLLTALPLVRGTQSKAARGYGLLKADSPPSG